MLCIPRESTASPVDNHPSLTVNTLFAPSSSPSSPSSRGRFFGGGRKEVVPAKGSSAPALVTSNVPPLSTDAVSPISPAWSMLSMTDAPSASVTAVSDDAPTIGATPSAPSSTLTRSSSRWLSLMRNGPSKRKRESVNDVVAGTVSDFGSKQAGLLLVTDSGSKSTMPRKKEGKTRLTLPWIGGKDTEKPPKQPMASSSRPTPAPIPLGRATRHSTSDEDDEDDLDDLEFSSGDELQMPLHQREQTGPSLEAPPPAAFYPPSRGLSSVALVETQPPTRRPKPSQSHANLLQLTSMGLQLVKQPAHPLITPRSNGIGAAPPLFPRSCNAADSLPQSRSVLVTLHKARVVQRLLEIPGNLTASEELSIMPFATRRPGVLRNHDRPYSSHQVTNSIYPSHFQLSSRSHASQSSTSSSQRVSLTRSLMIEDGDPMREPDTTGRGCSTWSRGLKQWVQRPTFEQRVVMWIPRSASGNRRIDELGAVRTAVYRPTLKAQTPLVFSRALEALAGVASPWQRSGVDGVTQETPLQHPKPIVASSGTRYTTAAEALANLHMPSPPQPSSSPSTSGSTDTGPSTPRSLGGSAQNLPVFAPGHGRSARHEHVAVSDDDDMPLGMVVRRHESDDTVTTLRGNERKKSKDGAKSPKKAFKNRVLGDRIRRESYRTSGRMEMEEEEIIPPTTRKGQPAAPVLASSMSHVGAAGSVRSRREAASESSRPIRLSGSIAASPSSRPPSVSISPDQTWLSNMNQFGQVPSGYMVPGAGLMLPPTAVPFHGGFPFGPPTMPMNPQLFYPPSPVMIAATRSASPGLSVGSMSSRRSSRYQQPLSPNNGEFGSMTPPKTPPIDLHSRSLPNRSAAFNGISTQKPQQQKQLPPPPPQHQPQHQESPRLKSSTLLPPRDESRHRRSASSLSQNSTPGSDQRPEFGRSNRDSTLLRPSLLHSSSISSRRRSEIS
ncbi:hypothetical protein FRB96_000106 [Tulasnella sp. 330]|nr:hypothetical protein FRB96_000106 [Tulasnella sp. 330]KAG8882925.1 hypothetical protein FRB97_007521 [Tulasnella sp. 331]